MSEWQRQCISVLKCWMPLTWKRALFHCIRHPVTRYHEPMWASQVRAGHKWNSLRCQLRLTCAVVINITLSNLVKLVVLRINKRTVCQTERHLPCSSIRLPQCQFAESLLKHCFVIEKKNKKEFFFFNFWVFDFVLALFICFCFSLLVKAFKPRILQREISTASLPGT